PFGCGECDGSNARKASTTAGEEAFARCRAFYLFERRYRARTSPASPMPRSVNDVGSGTGAVAVLLTVTSSDSKLLTSQTVHRSQEEPRCACRPVPGQQS